MNKNTNNDINMNPPIAHLIQFLFEIFKLLFHIWVNSV